VSNDQPRVIKRASERAFDAQCRTGRPTQEGLAGAWATAKDMGTHLAASERPSMDTNRRP
jgi:hypothetical protein